MQPKRRRMLGYTVLTGVLALLMGFAVGCQPIKEGKEQQPPAMVRVEVHFTGGSPPLEGFIKSLDLETSGMFFQGGSSSIQLYDDQGNIKAIVNYGRVEYIKTLP